MRKAVSVVLCGGNTSQTAEKYKIPARTLRRYVARAKKSTGLATLLSASTKI